MDIFQYGARALVDGLLIPCGKLTAAAIGFCLAQCRNQYLIVELRRRVVFEIIFDNLLALVLILRQHALVIVDVRFQSRRVAQQHRDKGHFRNIFGKHDQTHSERSCQQQTDRSPEPCPESGHDQYGYFGHAGALAVESRLEQEIDDQLDDHESGDDDEGCNPTRKIGQAQGGRHDGGGPRSDVRYEA